MTVDLETRAAIREAFLAGQLRVHAADPATGEVGLHVVSDVMQHGTPHKAMVRTTLVDGRAVETTEDHSLFHRSGSGVVPVAARDLRVGDHVATIADTVLVWVEVAAVETLCAEEHTYDLSVPGPQNFLMSNGILAHNSYSIGGVSLDIDKSSKYQSLKENAESQWDKLVEAKQLTTKHLLGLKQPRFGSGVRSSFGPAVGRGVLSPRSFM
jgi:hypothetical protein